MGEKKPEQFSVDEILEEHRMQQKHSKKPAGKGDKAVQVKTGRDPKMGLKMDEEEDQQMAKQQSHSQDEELQDIHTYTTASISVSQEGEVPVKRRGLFGLFGKKKKGKKPAFVEDEEETYYGIQLKPIDEYRKGYNQVTGEFSIDADSYATLFEESKKAIDEGEVEKNFERIQRERHARSGQSAEFTAEQNKIGIIPPSHVNQQQEVDQTETDGGLPAQQTEHPTPGKTNDIPRKKKKQGESRLQVVPRINTVYEYRSHGIPTHVINVKVLQDVLRSKEMFRTTIPGVTTVKPRPETPVRQRPVEIEQQIPPKVQPKVEPPVMREEQMQRGQPVTKGREIPTQPIRKPVVQAPPVIEEQKNRPVAPPTVIKEEKAPVLQKPIEDRTQKTPEISHAKQQEQMKRVTDLPLTPPQDDVKDLRTKEMPVLSKLMPPSGGMNQRPTMKIPALGEADTKQEKKPVRTEFLLDDNVTQDVNSQSTMIVEDADVKEVKGGRKSDSRMKWVEPEESVEDYNGPEDAKAVSDELKSDMRDLTLRMIITGGSTLLLALINIIFGGTFSSGQADLGSTPYIYIVLTLILLGVAIAVNFRTILNGLRALADFNPTSDSAVALATVGVSLQTILSFFFTSGIVDKEQHLYAVVLTAVLVANATGKLTMLRRIHSNFRFVTSKEQKYAAHVCENEEVANKMSGNVVVDNPVLVYQNKTEFLKRFLEMSYLPDPAETSSQMLAPIGLIASLVLCILCMLITKSIPSALGALAAGLIASVAVSNMLAVNMSVSRLSKLARRAGGMVVGYEAVERFGVTNAVAVDAEELFPTGTVTLNGIKTYNQRDDVEEAVLAASALVDVIGGSLGGVFEQVITENEENLPKVESFEYEYERGMVGRVDGKTVYVGNRALLLNHRIELPAKEEEAQYAVGGKQVLYIAVDTEVMAMMVMTYTADRRKKNEIQRLEDSGISVVVRTTDPNITVPLLTRLFGVDTLSLAVMSSEMSNEYQEFMSNDLARSDAVMATKGRIESFMSILSACVKEKRGVNLIVTLQTVAVVLGFVLVAFMACLGAIGSLTSFFLFLFEALGVAVILILPKLRR